jgi:hypothetical protein
MVDIPIDHSLSDELAVFSGVEPTGYPPLLKWRAGIELIVRKPRGQHQKPTHKHERSGVARLHSSDNRSSSPLESAKISLSILSLAINRSISFTLLSPFTKFTMRVRKSIASASMFSTVRFPTT